MLICFSQMNFVALLFFYMHHFSPSCVFRRQRSVSNVFLVKLLAKLVKWYSSHSFGEDFFFIRALCFGGCVLFDVVFCGFHKWVLVNLLFSISSRWDFIIDRHDISVISNAMQIQANFLQNKLCLLSWHNLDLYIWVVFSIYDDLVPTCDVWNTDNFCYGSRVQLHPQIVKHDHLVGSYLPAIFL